MNGSGADTRREIQGEDGKRWEEEEVINRKDKEEKEVMIVPEIVQLKVMKKVKKVHQMEQVKKGIESHLKRRLSKRATDVNLDPIDDAITKSIATDQLKNSEVPSVSGFSEMFNPQVTTGENGRKEIKSLIDVVRFPDEVVDEVVDGIRTRIDSLIPDKVKEVRQKTEAKAAEVLHPIILSASQLFNLNPVTIDEKIEKESSEDLPSLALAPRSKTQPSDSGLFHVFRGVLG